MILYLYISKNDQNKPSWHLSPYLITELFVVRTFKIYSLSNFQICNMVLTIVAMLCITSTRLLYVVTGSFHLLTTFTLFASLHSLLLASTNLFFIFWFRFHMKVISLYPSGLSMLLQMEYFFFFWWLINIWLYAFCSL